MDIELLLKPRWLITVDAANRVLTGHALAVRHGQIVGIMPSDLAEQHYTAQQVLELPQHAILPGLVNAHTHAAMSLLKGLADDLPLMEWLEKHIWPTEATWVSPEFVQDGASLAIAEMIRSGTTCFNDMYFFPKATLAAVKQSGIRAVLGMILIDFPTAYANHASAYLEQGLALKEKVAQNPLVTVAFAPHAPYTVSDESLAHLAALHHTLSTPDGEALPVHMHVHETATEVAQAVATTGERPLARLNRLGLLGSHFLAVHMTQLEREEIALLAAKGVNVVHCPESNLKLASGFCPVADLLAAGVNVALGTDGNASNNDLDLFSEMRTAALLGKAVAGDASAIPAHTALRMATINGAHALGLGKHIGSLEVGKVADLIAVDLGGIEAQPLYDPVSQLVYCTSREQVSHVWVAGKALLVGRKLQTLDEQDLLSRAHRWCGCIQTQQTSRATTGEQAV